MHTVPTFTVPAGLPVPPNAAVNAKVPGVAGACQVPYTENGALACVLVAPVRIGTLEVALELAVAAVVVPVNVESVFAVITVALVGVRDWVNPRINVGRVPAVNE